MILLVRHAKAGDREKCIDLLWNLKQQHRLQQVDIAGEKVALFQNREEAIPWLVKVLGKAVRQRKLMPLEEAINLITDTPAQLYGLKERGRVEEGWKAARGL